MELAGNKTAMELIRVALGLQERLSYVPSEEEWRKCYEFADRQAVMGVMWSGVKKLPKEQMPYLDLMMDWYGQVDYMAKRGKQLEEIIAKEVKAVHEAGMECVVLKGQGLAKMYPEGMVRTPGDIDLLLFAERERINAFCRRHVADYDPEKEGNLHTSYKVGDVTVEVHYTASFLTTPKYDRRLQEWIKEEGLRIKNGDFPTPSVEFNLVYLVLHMYRHYLFEGIGLRHVVDYIVVMQQANEEQRKAAVETLRWLGCGHFVGALAYVIDKLLNNKNYVSSVSSASLCCNLCKPDEWRGRMLWDAIIGGGNFGKSDTMNSVRYRQWGWRRLWRFVSRNSRLFVAYPSEIGWHVVRRFNFLRSYDNDTE